MRQHLGPLGVMAFILGMFALQMWMYLSPAKPCPPCPSPQVEAEDRTIEGKHWARWATDEYLRMEREGLIQPGEPATIKMPD